MGILTEIHDLREVNMVDDTEGTFYFSNIKDTLYRKSNSGEIDEFEYWGDDVLDSENKVYSHQGTEFIASSSFIDFYYYGDIDPTQKEDEE